jgi:hypothetical protein
MVRQDLVREELIALEEILDAHQAGLIALYTSPNAGAELAAIPEPYRQEHMRIFRLVRLVHEPAPPQASGEYAESLAARLRDCLSPADFDHVMQAVISKVDVFLTADRGILRQKELAVALGISVMSPRELVIDLRRKQILGPSAAETTAKSD